MSQHKALAMFGRSGNPSLNEATFTSESYGQGRVMTLQGTVNKTGILLALLVLAAVYP